MGILNTIGNIFNRVTGVGSKVEADIQKSLNPSWENPKIRLPIGTGGAGFSGTGTTNGGGGLTAQQAINNRGRTPGGNVVGYNPGRGSGMGADLANFISANSAFRANSTTDNWLRQQMEFQQASADKAMKFNREQAQLNRDWQERMSNTAYQRAMADMKRAGLNPILAYTQGGRTTPSGSSRSGYAMSGGSRSAQQAQVFKGYEGLEIFKAVASTAAMALSLLFK